LTKLQGIHKIEPDYLSPLPLKRLCRNGWEVTESQVRKLSNCGYLEGMGNHPNS
jgi:hypothetical protein